MAQAFDQTPAKMTGELWMFSDNPLLFTFYEGGAVAGSNLFDASTTTDFYFKVELYIEDLFISEHKVYISQQYTDGSSLVYAYGKFDCAEAVRNYASVNTRNADLVTTATATKYRIYFTPEYVSSGTPTSGTRTASTPYYAQKGKLTKQDWIDFGNDLLFTGGNNIHYTSQFPSSEQYLVALDEEVHGLFSMDDTITPDRIDIELFDATGSSITTTTFIILSPVAGTQMLNISPQKLIDDTALTTANFSTCASYTVELYVNATPTDTSGTVTFHIDADCTRFDHIRLYFLAKCGSIEAFTFKNMHKKTVTNKLSETQSTFGEWNEDAFEYSKESFEARTRLIESKEQITIHSDWMSEEVQNWLVKNLFTSPLIVMEQNSVFESVTIKSTTYEEKQHKNITLINETITLMKSIQNSSMQL